MIKMLFTDNGKILGVLIRIHFAYLILAPILGLASWFFIDRSSLILMVISGFAPVAAYYALLAERYSLTKHLPSALWAVFASPMLLLISSLLGGGFWFFYLDAMLVEVGGMAGGITVAAIAKGIKEREFFLAGVLIFFMGGFCFVWGRAAFFLHRQFDWFDNIWFVIALVIEIYNYSFMFLKRDLKLEFGSNRFFPESNDDFAPGPYQKEPMPLFILLFAVLMVLFPFIVGLLNYFFPAK